MGLRINTNISAQYSVMNLTNTNNKLSQSLNKLSTGLRITKAADDSAGMTIADGLKFQSMNLGQAINNGNNGIKLIQIADMALQKSIDIVQTIAQKATQAANATEDGASRQALQADINKYIEELNNIATTTSYKGVSLLDGTFTNKLIHVGAYMNQTLSISAQRTHSDSIGWVARSTAANTTEPDEWINSDQALQENASATTTYMEYNTNTNFARFKAADTQINGINIANLAAGIDEDQQVDAKTVAAAINSVKAQTGGVEAEAVTTQTGSAAITAGTISAGTFYINGVDIGQINVGTKDADNALVNKINAFQDQTGVVASKDSSGRLVLTAQDGRNIAVKASANVTNIIHIADSETTLSGTATHVTDGFSFYLNGIKINIGNGYSGVSAANAINQALAAQGIDTTHEMRASYTSIAADTRALKIYAIDGRDINIHLASGDADASHLKFIGLDDTDHDHDTNYIANNSYHGIITLTSTDTIAIAGDKPAVSGLVAATIAPNKNLADVDVTTQTGAELALKITQSALSDLDKVRSDLGSVQNQIQATVENISVTQININGAESTIRDVNFANESSNFSKLQILAQSGTYALAQANAVQQNVLRLLQ